MATWCLLGGLLKRIKYGKISNDVFSAINRLQTSEHKLFLRKLNIWSFYINSARMLYTSNVYLGHKSPKGKISKKDPLKTNKSIKLGRAYIHEQMTIAEVARALNKPIDHVYEVLMLIPDTESYDHDDSVLPRDILVSVVKKSGMIPEFISNKVEKEEESGDFVKQAPPDPSVLVKRPPVVTIMGHVDHGKTTLLDKLRNSNIVDQEFGGITQHIGAFKVIMPSGESICFLDTPGHAAFSAMRERGAHLTDIVVLVVAADDGVMQQTLESIHYAQDAGVPIIVAINKIDKNNADVARTKQMLLEHEIQLEEFGGDVQVVPISALKGTNLMELQEAIVTQAELMNLKGDPVGLVEGRVVEARIDEKRGRLVTAVIQRGTLKRGDYLIAGTAWGKVRAMFDEFGDPVQAAPPSTPVEILGFREIPSAGDELLQVKTESELKSVIAWRQEQEKKRKQIEDYTVIAEKREEHLKDYRTALQARREKGIHKERRKGPRPKEIVTDIDDVHYSMVLKGDVDGSVEAILDTLDTYHSKKCHLDIIHYGVGAVTESDVEMAAIFNGDLFAFNVMVPVKVAELAKSKKVVIKKHNIIYRLFDDLISSINKKLPKIEEHVVTGEAKVLQVFQVTLPNKTKANIAGCRCTNGVISKKLGIKVLRNDEIVYTGKMVSLKHFKEEVDSIKKEQECGIGIDDPKFAFEPQDVITTYEIKLVDQEVDWQPGF
ncbi:translation initiation factor IF-2, mitochondrial-like [Biomphalaria glabrata]|uniref:Translation initiation factor IF-2, mitochondrial n=1 Tax=Biomphalaria glabrata TaxID=6526 RepID=A0A2C9JYV5_BIOGL|nr:translation initiation factor IF-2, mitochondrial-like [Biomphalaria glabrata]XP_013089367.1 translation initiation factor IF-2, mitochondrial-like [Biomphalaria glabrata]XP_055880133.1 translation initiation factor IF-2, mitochondrial-like [Biomphalaria glabrata]XP_055880134.1 translation initiation factor IF-2, mitochondrial-like [Biomphalaria glabrata]KAI8744462.1 translation initiation factor IF-2, mitochondrial [Biomphalaria glabrata]